MTLEDMIVLALGHPCITDHERKELRDFYDVWFPQAPVDLEDIEIKIVDKGEWITGEKLA